MLSEVSSVRPLIGAIHPFDVGRPLDLEEGFGLVQITPRRIDLEAHDLDRAGLVGSDFCRITQ